MITETPIDCFLPSWWELQVTVAAAFFVIAAYWFFSYVGAADRSLLDEPASVSPDDKDKVISILFSFLSSLLIATTIGNFFFLNLCCCCWHNFQLVWRNWASYVTRKESSGLIYDSLMSF